MNNQGDELRELASQVGQIAYEVHAYFGNGLLEKVYESALEHRLVKAGYKVERQKPLKVFDEDGYCVGDYLVDMLVNDSLIVELKAAKSLAPEHFAQILNYLKITHNSVGLLVNFGSYKLPDAFISPGRQAVREADAYQGCAGASRRRAESNRRSSRPRRKAFRSQP